MSDLRTAHCDTVADDQLIHFNNAGASLMPESVLSTQIEYLKLEARLGGYEAAKDQAQAIAAIYTSVAALINAEAEEIALVENATVGWTSAFQSIDFKPGDKILTAQCEYGSNYMSYLQLKRRVDVQIEVIPSAPSGEICLAALEAMIDEKVKLISVTHIPTNGGLVNPICEIGDIAKRHGILYLVDACQTAGQLPIDVQRIGCDFLAATGRKYLRGPRGSGFLYVRKALIETLQPPLVDVRSAIWQSPQHYTLREDAKRFENWENNYAALLGLGRAVDYALDIGLQRIADINADLATQLRRQLAEIEGVTVWDIGEQQCAITSFSVVGFASSTLVEQLHTRQINVSCSRPGSTLLDATARKLPDLVRASVHYFNTPAQITRFCAELRQLIGR
ncbi:MAG: aminotransferase class V-fold PLP-dependent enzyme [Pseudomonadales bacterium]